MIVLGLTGLLLKTETSNFFKRNKSLFLKVISEINLLYRKRVVIKKVKEEFPRAFY